MGSRKVGRMKEIKTDRYGACTAKMQQEKSRSLRTVSVRCHHYNHHHHPTPPQLLPLLLLPLYPQGEGVGVGETRSNNTEASQHSRSGSLLKTAGFLAQEIQPQKVHLAP